MGRGKGVILAAQIGPKRGTRCWDATEMTGMQVPARQISLRWVKRQGSGGHA